MKHIKLSPHSTVLNYLKFIQSAQKWFLSFGNNKAVHLAGGTFEAIREQKN